MIASSLLTDNANSRKPTCEIVENASNRFNRYCAKPTIVPMTKDSKEVVNRRFFQRLKFIWFSENDNEKICSITPGTVTKVTCNCNKKIKMDILGITVNQVVTIVGTPSYTSGAQLWKGAAATLNKNPTAMISIPNITVDSFRLPGIIIPSVALENTEVII